MVNFKPIVLNERGYHSKNDTGIFGEKKIPTVPNRSRAQDLSIGSLDAFPLSYTTFNFVAGKAFLTNFLHTASARIGS